MHCQKTSERKKILQRAWMKCLCRGISLAERAALCNHSAEIFVLRVNLLHLGIPRLRVFIHSAAEDILFNFMKRSCAQIPEFYFFSPRLLQSCHVGPENWSGSPWRTCENESSSCGRADGKTWSHVDPSGVTLVYMPVHWHSSSGGNW